MNVTYVLFIYLHNFLIASFNVVYVKEYFVFNWFACFACMRKYNFLENISESNLIDLTGIVQLKSQ